MSLQKNAVLIFVLLSLLLTSFAYAQENGVPPPPEVGAGIPEQQNTRTERRAEFTEGMQNRMFNLSQNVANRFKSALVRMANISLRLESRIAKLKAAGVETTPAEAKLSEARISLENTRMSMTSFALAQGTLSGDKSKEAFLALKTHARAARESLILTHTLLRETVALLKKAVQNSDASRGVSSSVQNDDASSTAVLE